MATYGKKYLAYRNYPDPALQQKNQVTISFTKAKEQDQKKDEKSFLESLLTFQFEGTLQKASNEVAFNPVNEDMFVCGYGNFNE